MLEINNTTAVRVNSRELQRIAAEFARHFKLSGDISLGVVGVKRIRSLNRDYRGLDKPTDVLTFTGENEIIINIEDTGRFRKYREMLRELGRDIGPLKSAASRKRLSTYLLYFLFVHGLLHLAGYNDNTEKKRLAMIRTGRDFLAGIGLS